MKHLVLSKIIQNLGCGVEWCPPKIEKKIYFKVGMTSFVTQRSFWILFAEWYITREIKYVMDNLLPHTEKNICQTSTWTKSIIWKQQQVHWKSDISRTKSGINSSADLTLPHRSTFKDAPALVACNCSFSSKIFLMSTVGYFGPTETMMFDVRYHFLVSVKVSRLLNTSSISLTKFRNRDKKEEIWLSPMTKAPTPTEMSKGQWQHKQRHKKVRLNSGCGPT